ncbi:MAG: L-threonylcarbamoyladenylate synthase [Methylohalobius sp.]|nr:L-threonylcarbamoyladenylate synthase [Methylohalobius sp.]
MAQYFQIHPNTPQLRLIRQAVAILRQDGVIVYPTDSSYALACRIDSVKALERIRRIRQLPEKHDFTLVCRDLSQVAKFVRLGNQAHRLIKTLTPGPYTFILLATREVPKRLKHPSRKTVGIRLPDHAVAQALVAELQEPLFSTTLILPGEEMALDDPEGIRSRLESQVDLIIGCGVVPYEPTSIVDLTEDLPKVVRLGRGREKLEAVLGSPHG